MALNITINKVSVAASFTAGATVATAVASGGTAPYVYSLATGGDKFAINSSTGVITTIAAMDITNIASFSVTATDSTTGTALTGTSDVTYPPIQATIKSKFNRTNVIYKITIDINLGGGTLIMPAGCTLDFQGGSFTNGSIVFNNTIISGNSSSIFNVNITGTIKTSINPDWFINNKDYNKVQSALDLLVNRVSGSITLERIFNITGNTLTINKGQYPRFALRIDGKGGGLYKEDAGAMFTASEENSGDIYLTNLTFEGKAGVNVFVYDTVKIIRIHSTNNFYQRLWRVFNSETSYTQTVRSINDSYVGIYDTVFYFKYCYDIVCDGVLVEESSSFILDNHKGSYCASLTVTNSVIEGLTGKIISISGAYNLVITNNYFEKNKGYFEFTELGCRAFKFEGNYIQEDGTLEGELVIIYTALYLNSLVDCITNNYVVGSSKSPGIIFLKIKNGANEAQRITGDFKKISSNITVCSPERFFINNFLDKGTKSLSTGLVCSYKTYNGIKQYNIITGSTTLNPNEKKTILIATADELSLKLDDLWSFQTTNLDTNIYYALQFTGTALNLILQNNSDSVTSIEGYINILKLAEGVSYY